MAKASSKRRTDSASRVMKAWPQTIYDSFLDPDALVRWLPPKGMNARLETFEPREGGMYRMALNYKGSDHPVLGKAAEDSDVVEGRFIELAVNERIVQLIEFESDDSTFEGTMKMTWSLTPVP
jgi:uncharacterized protein YndB with AHSA1/START domain